LQERPTQTKVPFSTGPSHVPGWQTVPSGYVRQAPAPSQRPSRPQVPTGWAWHCPGTAGGAPSGTGAQVPIRPGTLHARQVSRQALEQQTPSTQAPDPHSS
jgi:hypothetical protein